MELNSLIERELEKFCEFIQEPLDSFESDSVGEYFQKLLDYCHKNNLSEDFRIYTNAQKRILNSVLSRPKDSPNKTNIQEDIVKYMILQLLDAAANDYGTKGKPLNHHWIPQTYAKSFTGKGKVTLSYFAFPPGLKILRGEVSIKTYFVHNPVKGKGFNDDPTEYYYSLLEGKYASDKLDVKETIGEENLNNVRLALFFYSQSVRYPNDMGIFKKRNFAELINDILENIYSTEEIYAQRAGAQYLMFSSENPRLTVLSDGIKTISFPISSTKALVVSTKPLSKIHAKKIAVDSNKRLMIHAVKNNKLLFGTFRGEVISNP